MVCTIAKEANVDKSPSMALFGEVTLADDEFAIVLVAVPNRKIEVAPPCAPTPPSSLPAVGVLPETGVTMEPTKNLPIARAVSLTVVALNVTAPPDRVGSS